MIKYDGEDIVDGAYYKISYNHEFLEEAQEVIALKQGDHWYFTMMDKNGQVVAASYEHDDNLTIHWRVPTIEEVNDANTGGT